MPLSLTCACGARFEVDDALGGQEVSCPECRQKVAAGPARSGAPTRTSELALMSVALALFGAFTVIGSALAAVLGMAALIDIHRHRDRLTGVGFSLFGIVAGIGFTILTLFTLSTSELFGLGGWARERMMADQLDTRGPQDITIRDFTLSKPSELWGRVKGDRLDDTAVYDIQNDRALLLANASRYAFIDVQVTDHPPDLPTLMGTERDRLLTGANPFVQDEDDDDFPRPRAARPVGQVFERERRSLAVNNGFKGLEGVFDVRRGGQLWRFLVRVYQPDRRVREDKTRTYIVRAYTPRRRFEVNEAELRKGLDSFQIRK
jgi:hypothetical protein